jgi:hypothetical protein
MWKRIRRLLGRPKTGQNYYPHSLSLTLRQKAFLDEQPNASELVRNILDDLIAVQKEIEPKTSVISLKRQIDLLQGQASKLYQERINYLMEQRNRRELSDSINENGAVWDAEAKSDKPAVPSTPEEKYHLTVLLALKAQEERTRVKIQELKEQVIKSS